MEKIEVLALNELMEIKGGYKNPAPGMNLIGVVLAGKVWLDGFFEGTDIF